MTKNQEAAIVWFRRDLRLHDHHALSIATKENTHVYCVFVFDTVILSEIENKEDRRVTFIHESLIELDMELKKIGSKLFVLKGDPVKEIPNFARMIKAQSIYVNKDYEPYAYDRDHQIKKNLAKENIEFKQFKDSVVFEEKEILNLKKEPFRVYTPYKKTWLAKFKKDDHAQDFQVKRGSFVKDDDVELKAEFPFPTLKEIGFKKSDLWLKPGRSGGLLLLKAFIKRVSQYHLDRDQIDSTATSRLSVHLRFGTVSVRECIRSVSDVSGLGKNTWISELIWRDFFQMILSQFSYVEKKPFRAKYEGIKWPGKESHFKLWCEGKTGFPLVDAAMRHFNQTGWMHNRLRMVVATFLVKDLLVDYKKGERYFAENLLDFDLAANNGNWQWCASTGCDAQPYFRIFNPETQQKKFDPNFKYVRSYCKEFGSSEYPAPIVDHNKQRQLFLKLFS
jgi:deoxyribodipyrimidine photo-lyase